MELYIIRHGQSVNNAMPEGEPRTPDAPLNDLGQRQAEILAAYLADGRNRDPWYQPSTGYSQRENEPTFGITHLYASPMRRALQTAAPIAAALNLQPEVWVDVHEHGGVYQQRPDGITGFPGWTRAEMIEAYPHYVLPESVTERGWWNPARGSEPYHEALARAIKVAGDMRRRAAINLDDDPPKTERVAIVTHGTFIDALIKAFLHQLPNRQHFYLHYNTAITRIDFIEKDRLLMRYINRVAHLPPELVT
jgi:broad specificity phosphatase PhoE